MASRVQCDGCGKILEPGEEALELKKFSSGDVEMYRLEEAPWPRHAHLVGACVVRAAGLGRGPERCLDCEQGFCRRHET